MAEIDIDDLLWLAICLYHEARGESLEGKIAVCHVILNRADRHGPPLPVKDVILKPMQFSWANHGARPAIRDYQALIDCAKAAETCRHRRRHNDDFFEGADHYYASSIEPPAWAKDMTMVKKVGRHIFFRSRQG